MKYRVSIVIHLFISTMPYQLKKVCELRFLDSGGFLLILSPKLKNLAQLCNSIFSIFLNERFPPAVHRVISLNTAFLNIFMKNIVLVWFLTPFNEYHYTIPERAVYISVVWKYIYQFTSHKKNKIQKFTVMAWTYTTTLILPAKRWYNVKTKRVEMHMTYTKFSF